ncbi:TonB-dependent receptor [Aestuariivivens sp. NBU2969]|uniref:TonB-dependent receptor n=1 Tax=Aestuariivivens sp. NBU2969 TaxID=2873267 RepID=UPI001CBF0AE2|nr:TonB-dependent receptor [Aestuariivivens sp. NBU2969]
MRKHIKHITVIVFLLEITLVFAQRKQSDTLNTGVIDVVKPYTPSISDAFKVKETPTLDDAVTDTKKDIKYNIFSIPVASTFTPAKGKAAVVEKTKPVKLYDNYATLGVGTYTTLLGELYLNHAISRTESVGGYLSHHSSQGGIEGVQFEDDFSDSKINVNYSSRLRDLSWNVEGGFQRQTYNWYGVEEALVNFTKSSNIQVDHSFYSAHFGGDIAFEDTYINSGSFFFRRFGDNHGSGENRFKFKTIFDIPIGEEELSTDLVFDYIGGSFDISEALNYGNFQIGVGSQYEMKQDDLTVNFGASLFYLSDKESGDGKFYIYPKITATYRLVNDVLIAYAGIEGGVIQNSYYDFANENPFVSPTLFIMPTDQQYNAYVGLKGKLSSNMSYNISGGYLADRNKALYRHNTTFFDFTDAEDYQYSNSFGLVYDDVNTFSLAGGINVDVNRNFTLGIRAEYFSYSTNDEEEAWNLPDIKGSLFLDYQIDEHWFAGANLFYIGERQDLLSMIEPFQEPQAMVVTLDSYFDANAHLGYNINDKIAVFAKANNIANNTYQRWMFYPVQGIQFLAGATFKFDF